MSTSARSLQPDVTATLMKVEGVVSVGTDLLESQRIERTWQRHGERFARRILTPSEQTLWQQRQRSLNFLAKQYAAKEALAKALGTGIAKGVGFQEMTVLREESGAPIVTLNGRARERMHQLGGQRALLSLSDDAGLILAFAVLA